MQRRSQCRGTCAGSIAYYLGKALQLYLPLELAKTSRQASVPPMRVMNATGPSADANVHQKGLVTFST